MKKPEITPGKWAKDKKAKSRIHAANDRQVAACGGHTSNVNAEQVEAENDANATAIAALPDLLEALESALPMLVECNPQDPELWNNEGHCPQDHPNCCLACATFYKIRAALTKAGYTF